MQASPCKLREAVKNPTFSKQFCFLLYKEVLIRSRNRIQSLLELGLPVLMIVFFWGLIQTLDSDEKPAMAQMFSLVLYLVLSLNVTGFVESITAERESGMRDFMNILGLNELALHCVQWIVFSCTMTVISACVAGPATKSGLYGSSTFEALFFFFWAFSVGSVSFALFMSLPYSSAKMARTATFVLYFAIGLTGSAIKKTVTATQQFTLVLFFPQIGWTLGRILIDNSTSVVVIGNSTQVDFGLNLDNFRTPVLNGFSMALLVQAMCCSSVMYFLVYAYLDQWIARGAATKRPWHFPLSQCFCFKYSSSAPVDSLDDGVKIFQCSMKYSQGPVIISNLTAFLRSGDISVILGPNGSGKTR